jgi:hypothetical protein
MLWRFLPKEPACRDMPFKYSVCNGGDVKVKEADEITYFNGFIEKYRGEIRPF